MTSSGASGMESQELVLMFQKKIFNISNKSYLAIFVSKIFKRTQETADDDNDEKKVLPICLTGLKDTFLIKDK